MTRSVFFIILNNNHKKSEKTYFLKFLGGYFLIKYKYTVQFISFSKFYT